jgi:ketosteroid isomerase-like protein
MEESRQREMEGLARRSIDAYNRGDVEALLEQLDEEIEVYTPPELPNAGTYRGHQGFLQWLGQWDEAWEEFRLEIERIDFVGDRCGVVTVRQFGRGGDKAARLHYYPDRETAVAAAERLN